MSAAEGKSNRGGAGATLTDGIPGPTVRTRAQESTSSRAWLMILIDTRVFWHPLPEEGEVILGRADECDVQIDDRSVSRRHARLQVVGDLVTVEDLGSANGTRIGDAPLAPGKPESVPFGTSLTVGAVTVLVQRRGAPHKARRLLSHDYFELRLEEECARAERDHVPFAIVHVRSGKAADGEAVLDALAQAFRPADVVGLFAPGEFTALLTATKSDAAFEMTKRFETELGRRGLSAKIALACYPRDGRSAEELAACARGVGRGPPTGEDHALGGQQGGVMRELERLVEQVARSHINVLILGETGVGKEVMADRIHRSSNRTTKPFLRLNCAALPENLLESELFGHEKGSFTGADRAKPGLLETADQGTVFLDEIGELPLSIQVKLLRVIEERVVLPVGGLKPRSIDVRFLAATNRDLEAEIKRGAFRADLFYRLDGFSLVIPPLRERVSEIEGLARGFIAEACRRSSRPIEPALSPEALALLQRYSWPGNIRELRNCIERAVLLCQAPLIGREHLPAEKMSLAFLPASSQSQPTGPAGLAAGEPSRSLDTDEITPIPSFDTPPPLSAAKDEREKILAALAQCSGNQSTAAKLLGMSRGALVKRLDAYKIPRPRKGRAPLP